jgi:xanthine dehydrogenase accessory factor
MSLYKYHYRFPDTLVLIRGGGDLASGAAYRLAQAGFPIIITELAMPLAVRTTVSYGMAALQGAVIIEGITARKADPDQVTAVLAEGVIPVLVDPDGSAIQQFRPAVVIDARLAKQPLDTQIDHAPLVIGLGPGFTVGRECHAVIETNRGHWLGRVYWQGSAEPDTGVPGSINGKTTDRVLRAPDSGFLSQPYPIGSPVKEGAIIAYVNGVPVHAPFDGVLRGIIEDVGITTGLKIGDVDPRARREHCFTISDKSLAIGGGVLEAILSAPQLRRSQVLQSKFAESRAKS